MRSIILVSFVLVMTPLVLKGQRTDTTLKSTTIEVVQSYKPEVKQAPKPMFIPELPPRDTSPPRFQYNVPQQTLYYTYSALPLRPLALGRDTTKLPFSSSIKLGAGNFSTKYLDAGTGSLKGQNYETAIHLHHLSQEGNIKHQKISLSGIEAEGTLHKNDHAWRLSLDGQRNQYHYFGYNHDLLDFPEELVRQTFTGAVMTFDFYNEVGNRTGIGYHPRISTSFYNDAFDASERTVTIDLPFTKDFDTSVQAGLGLNGTFTSFSVSYLPETRKNNIIQFTPFIKYNKEGFRGRIGLYPAMSNVSDNVMLLPDINVSFKIPNTQLSLVGGWEARLRQNSYKQLTCYNPYLFNTWFDFRNTRTDEVFGMLQTNVGDHITASARVSWWQFDDLPLFLNDTLDRKSFYILYDKQVKATSLQASIRYQVANTISAGIGASFYNFYNKSYDRVWHEPGIRFKGDLQYRPVNTLVLTAYATILDQIYAKNEAHQEIKLDGVFDIGAGAEYQFIPRLSAFLNVNNLLNDRYQRWYGYQTFALNIFGGLRLQF